MFKNLVIVESPTKAKTISRFLDSSFKVESSFGHIRDLPKSKMGVDIENNFTPSYIIPTKAKKKVNELKKLAKLAQNIYFATDEDREGEAIAWHLNTIFDQPANSKRITFHEITEQALKEALTNPRVIDLHLVDAQQARRILDRLVGYELSPFLWKKVARGLSAGRVQSVAVRLVTEREKEIQDFKAREYWTIEAVFNKDNEDFTAVLSHTPEKKLGKFDIADQQAAEKISRDLQGKNYEITKITERESIRNPLPPFTTSTLQQQANRQLGFSAKQTMMLAQQLYEGIELGAKDSKGLITYMRTDSVNLADKFLKEAEETLSKLYGQPYVHLKKYQTKSKLAQEAHEAIRPTNPAYTPESIKDSLNERQYKLYNLIWKRTMASQMSSAKIKITEVLIKSDNNYLFTAKGSVITFDGFLKLIPNGNGEQILPQLQQGEKVKNKEIKPVQHFTQPPARYSEAGLVKALEEYGIGRPSTYAPTIATIQERKYVEKENKRFKPTDIGITVNDLLVNHFPEIVDYQFTAHLENDLDEIAQGKKQWTPIIKEFYMPFKKNLTKKENEISKKQLTEETTDQTCEKCNNPMIIKLGRFGKFLACSNYPDCKNTKPLNSNGEIEKPETTDQTCEKCGKPMVIKNGRYGKFLGCSGYPDCKNIKNIVDTTGVKCPECQKGEIVAKRGRSGKNFYACNKYPDCKFILWSKPTGEKCPQCDSLLIMGPNNTFKCSAKECEYNQK
ncbi:type I DNA topoisomerase [Patescibacteria group bacterium]|nr:type I DNA topoisomerase [Patescibacteria group bacterium]